MKSERLQNAIGMIDADLLERSEKPMKKKRKIKIKITAAVAAILVCAIGLGIFFGNQSPVDLSVHAISVAQYPEMSKYPAGTRWNSHDLNWKAWDEDQAKQHAYFGSSKGLESFVRATASEILSGDGTENRVYSPMSLYMALAMLAEISDGNTRAQILNLLGAESIEALRTQAHGIWNANYNDDGAVTSILASSLWLDNDIAYQKEILDILAEFYYASSFSGEMGSEELNLALREWLNEQTGGQLKDQIDDIAFDPRTVLGLATTVYFRAKWYDEFSETKTKKGVFHGANKDVTVDFMNTTSNVYYWWGENFSATVKALERSGCMYWILPDENVTAEMLLQDEDVWRFIGSTGTYENGKKMKVNLSVPKFDVSFDTDLVENLKNLGLTDCFSYENSDFSHLLEASTGKGVVVDELQHGTRVSIDEDGVTGMSYSVIMLESMDGIKPTYEEIDFVVDRPYIFVIKGEDGSVMFVGVVNQL